MTHSVESTMPPCFFLNDGLWDGRRDEDDPLPRRPNIPKSNQKRPWPSRVWTELTPTRWWWISRRNTTRPSSIHLPAKARTSQQRISDVLIYRGVECTYNYRHRKVQLEKEQNNKSLAAAVTRYLRVCVTVSFKLHRLQFSIHFSFSDDRRRRRRWGQRDG